MCYLTFHLIRVLLRKTHLPLKGKAFLFVRKFLVLRKIGGMSKAPSPTMFVQKF